MLCRAKSARQFGRPGTALRSLSRGIGSGASWLVARNARNDAGVGSARQSQSTAQDDVAVNWAYSFPFRQTNIINPLIATLKPLATDHRVAIQWLVHWPLMGGLLHLVQRGGDWAGPQPAQAPPRCTKCNSPPINGQCINFVLFDHYNCLWSLKS